MDKSCFSDQNVFEKQLFLCNRKFRWNPLLHKKALPGRIALRRKGRCRRSDPPQAENPAGRILVYKYPPEKK